VFTLQGRAEVGVIHRAAVVQAAGRVPVRDMEQREPSVRLDTKRRSKETMR